MFNPRYFRNQLSLVLSGWMCAFKLSYYILRGNALDSGHAARGTLYYSQVSPSVQEFPLRRLCINNWFKSLSPKYLNHLGQISFDKSNSIREEIIEFVVLKEHRNLNILKVIKRLYMLLCVIKASLSRFEYYQATNSVAINTQTVSLCCSLSSHTWNACYTRLFLRLLMLDLWQPNVGILTTL